MFQIRITGCNKINTLCHVIFFANLLSVRMDLMKPFRIHERLEYRILLRGTVPHIFPCNNGLQTTFPSEEIQACLSDLCTVSVSSSQFLNQFTDFHEIWCEFKYHQR